MVGRREMHRRAALEGRAALERRAAGEHLHLSGACELADHDPLRAAERAPELACGQREAAFIVEAERHEGR